MTPRDGTAHETITHDEARALVASGEVRILDVRNPDEWSSLGTIPGAVLLPVDLAAAAAATLPRDGPPVLVYCEHGVRSAMAAGLLAAAGVPRVLDLAGGMSCWTGPREFGARPVDTVFGPSSWLLANVDLLRNPGSERPRALDLACGRGRHALLLAAAGFAVRALDRDTAAIAVLADTAARLGLPVEAGTHDLETAPVDLGEGIYDLILVVHYLHRPLFPALCRALRPGGILIYETYTEAQAARGRPTNPDFLLKHGELRSLVAPLAIVRERDGEFDGGMVAGVAARRDA
jgi:rhodanese-related sulfurtransferase